MNTYFSKWEQNNKEILPMSFFSWMNLTLDRTSADSSIAWLKPFSPPYEMSTSFKTLACNLCGKIHRNVLNIKIIFYSELKSDCF